MKTQGAGQSADRSRGSRAHWWSSERAQALFLAGAIAALELLTIDAWLLLTATYVVGAMSGAALPFWLLCAVFAGFALVARGLRDRSAPLLGLCFTLVGVAALALTARVSPSAYPDAPGGLFDGAWLQAFGADAAALTPRFGNMLRLTVLVGFVGWRGVALGGGALSPESVLNRFRICVVAVVLAVVGAVAAPEAARPPLLGALALTLPLVVFFGLLAAALTRVAVNREAQRRTDPRAVNDNRWLVMALALAVLVVGGALVLSLVLTYDGVSAALRQLGPIGAALDAGERWLVEAFARLLGFLLDGPIQALKHWLGTRQPTPTPTPRPTAQGAATPARGNGSDVPLFALIVAQVMLAVFALLAVIATTLALVRIARRRMQRADTGGVEEEREALDGRSLFRAQLRDLLDRFGRRAPGSPEETLPAGGMRALYRELLRAAAARGLGRAPGETPDEHARRLGDALEQPAASADAASVAEAYDAARYGEHEPAEGERRAARERAGRVREALRRHDGAR